MNLPRLPFLPPYNFAGIEGKDSSLEKARFVVLPVPYEATTTYVPGTRRGPSAILEASRMMELYDEEIGKEISSFGIHTLPSLDTAAAGPEEMVGLVRDAVSWLVSMGKTVITLGGEHTITVGAVTAISPSCPELSVLHLDAHTDLRDTYQGSPFSHACCMRRVVESLPVTHVGIRSMSKEEAEFVEKSRSIIVYARDFLTGKKKIADVVAALTGKVYITIDMDVFDPSCVPAVGTPEPGGLGWYETNDILRAVAKEKEVVGFDVVELCPIPGDVSSDYLAARLIYKMIGYCSL
ncbi:MAG: agmatinase [Candidatus Eisenbacteria bacterium]|nr:agmatinase [Candidatus Eisenbacteria bacterium]